MNWKLLAVAAGGGLDAVARMGLGGFIDRRIPEHFPWDTMAVNVIGCILYGIIWYEIDRRVRVPADVKPFLITGFLGAFTTFSTFAYNSAMLLEKGQPVRCGEHRCSRRAGCRCYLRRPGDRPIRVMC